MFYLFLKDCKIFSTMSPKHVSKYHYVYTFWLLQQNVFFLHLQVRMDEFFDLQLPSKVLDKVVRTRHEMFWEECLSLPEWDLSLFLKFP